MGAQNLCQRERDPGWFVAKISKHDALHPWKPSGLLGMEKVGRGGRAEMNSSPMHSDP